MEGKKKYGLASLHRQFPDNDSCLGFIFNVKHPRECRLQVPISNLSARLQVPISNLSARLQMPPQTAARCGGIYRNAAERRQFQCSKCRNQVAPTAETIFNKSGTPLVLWFHAILAFFNARGEISAKQLERDLEVTYKCAWRILTRIRVVLDEYIRKNPDKLTFTDVLSVAIKTKYSSKMLLKKKKRLRRFKRVLA